jgi:hypothetical protein
MEQHKDIRPSVEIRQAQQEAAEKIAAAKERGDLAAAQSVLKEFSEQMRAFREHFGSITEALGQNFLGVAAWKNIGVDVGEAPPLPKSLTLELLNSECPLHPREKIKDTHILVLVPKTVNGEPYTVLKLDELCAQRKGSGDRLIFDWATAWKSQSWAIAPQAQSEWVLIPKSDPDPERMIGKYGEEEGDKHHFRSKDIPAQQEVHNDHYKEYREVKAVELMTAVLLYDLTHKERLLRYDYLRCKEPNAFGGRVCVGLFPADGLKVHVGFHDNGLFSIGRALARKS